MKTQINRGSPQVVEDQERPSYILHRGSGLSIDPESAAPIGPGGVIDVEAVVARRGLTGRTPIEILLLAIVDAHPMVDLGTRGQRLDKALQTLTGQIRKRGMHTRDDEPLLLEIARRYHMLMFSKPVNEPIRIPAVIPIIRQLIAEGLVPRAMTVETESVVRRLQRKFTKERDVWLARASAESDWYALGGIRRLHAAIRELRALGIPICVPDFPVRGIATITTSH